MRTLLIVGVASAALCVAPALAQTRPGMPDVTGASRPGMPDVMPRRVDSDPDAGTREIFDDFSVWNRRAGTPKMLVLWNRELTDDSATRYRAVNRGVSAVASRPGLVVGAYEQVEETEENTGGEYADLLPDDSAELETGFLSAFLSTGGNMVDRRALMRKVSTGFEAADRSDKQHIESHALEQGIDYLVEVLPNYVGDTSTGFIFMVKITHLPSSTIKSQFRTEALPARGPARLVAAPGGFERRVENRTAPDTVARTLAAETMRAFF